MSVSMSVLAILDEGPSYGLQLKNEFEVRTGGIWPLNVGQVYTTLDRLERDGLIRSVAGEAEGQKAYEVTATGRGTLDGWFQRPVKMDPPPRDELVLKLVMAIRHPDVDASDVIQAERKGAIEQLRDFTMLKREPPEATDLGWLLLVESLVFQLEARVRWLDACEARLDLSSAHLRTEAMPTPARSEETILSEVLP